MRITDRFFGLLALLLVGSASLKAQTGDPFGDVDTYKYQGTMTITAQVKQNGNVVTDAVVAVYQEDELRGKKRVGDGTHPELAFLTVYGDYTGSPQYLRFKVYTNGMTFECNPNPSITYEFYGSLGTPSNPYVITLPVSLANDADNSDVLSTFGGQTCDVVLAGRTLFKDGSWNTLCLPFSLSAEQIAASTDFAAGVVMELDVTEKNGFDTTDGTLYLYFKTATAIEAGVPYLVKWEKAADYETGEPGHDISNPVFGDVTISSTAAQAVESTTTGLEKVQMVGTYSPVSVTADDKSILFMGDANTLYYSSIDRQLRSCRAYFSIPYIKNHAGAKVRAFRLNFDGVETTGILEVPRDPDEIKDDVWYSLDGVRLSEKPIWSGTYIHKGKKTLVK